MSDDTPTSADAAADTSAPGEPTQAEIDAWVAEEKARRQAWLKGPTAEERAAYARRLRHRKLADTFDEGEHHRRVLGRRRRADHTA